MMIKSPLDLVIRRTGLTFASIIEEMEQKPNCSELKNKLVVSKLRPCFQCYEL